MLDVVLQTLGWIVAGGSILGKGFVSQISNKQRMWGFILLAITGFYWIWQMYLIAQWQMAGLQVVYTILNVWGAYNSFHEIYIDRSKIH